MTGGFDFEISRGRPKVSQLQLLYVTVRQIFWGLLRRILVLVQ